jgi:hypothetical protein
MVKILCVENEQGTIANCGNVRRNLAPESGGGYIRNIMTWLGRVHGVCVTYGSTFLWLRLGRFCIGDRLMFREAEIFQENLWVNSGANVRVQGDDN